MNDAPLAVDDQVTGVEDQIIQNIDLLANDSDVDDALTVVEVESSQGASITFNEDGTIDYVPLPNFVGTDTLTYTIEDGNGETSTATITVDSGSKRSAHRADLAFETDQDESLGGIDVLASAEDVDGDDLTITAGVSENGGLVNFDDDGQLTHTPPQVLLGPTSSLTPFLMVLAAQLRRRSPLPSTHSMATGAYRLPA